LTFARGTTCSGPTATLARSGAVPGALIWTADAQTARVARPGGTRDVEALESHEGDRTATSREQPDPMTVRLAAPPVW
jgi:hypothetical protein